MTWVNMADLDGGVEIWWINTDSQPTWTRLADTPLPVGTAELVDGVLQLRNIPVGEDGLGGSVSYSFKLVPLTDYSGSGLRCTVVDMSVDKLDWTTSNYQFNPRNTNAFMGVDITSDPATEADLDVNPITVAADPTWYVGPDPVPEDVSWQNSGTAFTATMTEF